MSQFTALTDAFQGADGRRRLVGLIMLISAAFMAAPFPALGQETDQGVRVKVSYNDPEAGSTPAVGVAFSVTADDGTPVGDGVTDDEGVFFLTVESPGIYSVTIDPTTLPEGVGLRDPERVTATVTVDSGRAGSALFGLQVGDGPVGGDDSDTLRSVLQLTTEGIKLGLFLAMGAIGLSLIFGTTGLVNFAHAEMITWGMFIAFLVESFASSIGLLPDQRLVTIILGALTAIVVGGVTGWLMNRYIFRPLRLKGTSLIAQMVVTIGVGILARYIILYFFGGGSRFYRSVAGQRAIQIGVVDITPGDLTAVILSILVLVVVGLLLQRTRIGRAMRAVSDNRDLAESSGIDVQRVISQVWVAGGALAALGGVFIAQADQVLWEGGFRVLLLIFAGVTLGGLGTAYGALVGCLLIGLGIQLSTLFIPIELKNVGALVVMALVLLVRPQGILGRKERIG